MQANQTAVIWTVIIATVVLLVSGFLMVNSMKNAIPEIPEIPAIPTAGEIAALISVPAAPEAPEVDNEKVNRLCDVTEGCDGQWDLNNVMRNMAVNVVMDELTNRDNKALYSEIKDIVDIREREDINSVSVHDDNGEMTVNQEDYDSLYDANDDTLVTVEFVIEVDYFDDEDNEDRTRWFKVTATISDVEDGISEGDVTIVSVERVSEHFEFD